ncbi:MAG: peptidoglycan DD-metalloendopeptidase family protein [bacterium]|nr:peptidoglycan DD-metalloendopeptidase family protein [bacterium]
MKKGPFLLAFLLLVVLHPYSVFSADCEQTDLQNKINCLSTKVAELGGQAKTLSSQIASYDVQIRLTSLKIEQTEDQIASLSGKITTLEGKLQERSHVLEKQIMQTYKKGPIDALQILFSSANVSEAVSRFKYLQIVQANNRKFLHDTQLVQATYAQQKDLVEESKKRLESQKISLAALRVERDNLLKQTKSSEAVYQKQLEQARLELEAIQRALVSAVKEGPVKAGDPIALMGNSGYPSCSTGKHLHFEVRQGDGWVNAETYLKNMTDKWGLNIGGGNWDWPVKGTIEITQRYGKTPYSYVYAYSGGIHTGIDMVSDNEVIYAVADGTLYSSRQKCGSSDLNIKYIDHGNGLKTLYLHVK